MNLDQRGNRLLPLLGVAFPGLVLQDQEARSSIKHEPEVPRRNNIVMASRGPVNLHRGHWGAAF
jgi:hypothetical protein